MRTSAFASNVAKLEEHGRIGGVVDVAAVRAIERQVPVAGPRQARQMIWEALLFPQWHASKWGEWRMGHLGILTNA